MNTALWVVQCLVAFGMIAAGSMKLVRSKEQLAEAGMGWTKTWSQTNVRLLGLAEVLGGIGLVVPWATHILPQLTPIAALCLFVLMIGAVLTHLRLKENGRTVPALVLALLCIYIAWGRHGVLGF